jgi:hypothetical protein
MSDKCASSKAPFSSKLLISFCRDSVRGRTRITQAVGSQKTVIDYNGGPANLGPHRVLYTSGQGSSPLRASPVVACRALSATPLLLSGPLAVPGRGRYAPGAPPPMGRLYSIQGSAVGRVRAGRLPRLCLGAVQAASKGSPRHRHTRPDLEDTPAA